MVTAQDLPDFNNVQKAAERLKKYVHRTPILTSQGLDRICGAQLYFKCENFQKVGAFKIRGATNAVLDLPEKMVAAGVATHSSGNHAAALALAARWRNCTAYVVMPRTAPQVKINAVQSYGAQVTFCEPTLEAREQELTKVISRTGAEVIHPYNDARVIAGQGTVALELLTELPDLDAVLVPVGGGGLLSGTALTSRGLKKKCQVIGVEPQNADDAHRSFYAGRIIPSDNPQTIADGLRTSLGALTFAIIRDKVDDILTVTEESIIDAMRLIWERLKIVAEPSACVPLAVLIEGRSRVAASKIGIILSGGNVDLDRLPWLKDKV